MPGPKLDPVESDAALPRAVDVVIIGGGIAGTCAALELVDRGLKVAICEKGQIGAEQSSRNWGWVRLTHRDPREMPLMVEAVRMWEGLNERVEAETGYRQSGVTYTCTSDDMMEEERQWVDLLQSYQIPAKMLNRDEALAHYPGIDLPIKGAIHNPMDGRAEPQKAAPAVARAVQARGGTVHQNTAVRMIDVEGGKVTGVITEHGRIACSQVLLAGGIWSRLMLDNMGIYLPQLRTKNTVLRTSALEGGPEGTIKFKEFAMRKRLDGGYTIASSANSRYEITPDSFRLFGAFLPALKNEWRGLRFGFGSAFVDGLKTKRKWSANDVTPFEETRIMDPQPETSFIEKVYHQVAARWPAMKGLKIEQRWAGIIDVLPDVIPVISDTESVKNGVKGLYVSTGFSGHGFGLGPGAGRLAADLMTGHAPIVDPTPFRLSRFSDGSKIAPMSGITRR
ncbi:FAD-binding oxidoreductase [Thioclava sp. GXIMD2076]|uniref:NAD(P)/FAD-dependent oxidoreductase n=1 Tax=Thioclava sp. GXIMD2076 TaxID=3131931 RepID=UPI0030D19D72